MKTLSSWLDWVANWKILTIMLAIYLVFPVYFFKNAETQINTLAGKTVGPIDLTMGFNPQQTLQMVANYNDAARVYYAVTEMTLDVVYPIVYAFLLSLILTLLFRNQPYKPFTFVNLLPYLTLIFDYLENSMIVTLLKTYPQQSFLVATLCEVFKLVKWLSFGAIILLILYGLVRLLFKTRRA